MFVRTCATILSLFISAYVSQSVFQHLHNGITVNKTACNKYQIPQRPISLWPKTSMTAFSLHDIQHERVNLLKLPPLSQCRTSSQDSFLSWSSACAMVAFSLFKTLRRISWCGLTARSAAKRSFAMGLLATPLGEHNLLNHHSPLASITPIFRFRHGTRSSRHLLKSSQ